MRKSKLFALLCMLLIVMVAVPASASILDSLKDAAQTAKETIGTLGSGIQAVVTGSNKNPILVYVDGNLVHFPDQQPYIDQNSRTLVPVRFVSEALGAKVDWKGQKQEVDINHEAKDKRVLLWVGKRDYTVNGVTARMDTQAVLTDQARVMVPLRFVSEALGADVRWEVIAGNGTVFTFTLGQSDDEIKAIIDRVRAEIEKETHGVTVIPDSQWSYDKPKVGINPYYFSEPDVKIAYATVDQFPIKTKHYTIKSIELTPTHIVVNFDPESKINPELYVTEGKRLWVNGSYGDFKSVYKYPFDDYIYGKDYYYDPISWGEGYEPLTYERVFSVDYLNFCIGDYILAIENPWKGGK